MGKFLLYAVIILILAFAANFFGILSIPWLDSPVSTDKTYYTGGRDRMDKAVNEALNTK